ncbi:MAG: Hsp20/alpha crystallin family protein [Halanaeroarchaeum sp.]
MTVEKPQFVSTGRRLGERFMEQVGRVAARVQETTPLRADVLESKDAFLVVVDAPGAHASDVQVRFTEGVLEVRIDRFREFREDAEMIFPGRGLSMDGRIELPEDATVDAAGASAELRADGTLHVTLPKASDDRPTQDEDVELDDGDS